MDGGRLALRPEPPVRFCCLCRLEGGVLAINIVGTFGGSALEPVSDT
jgi:hypothetical protein